MTRPPPKLAIEAVKPRLLERVGQVPLVVSSATGSGKSTLVPAYCASRGRVLVIEPRRVACRSLAARVAELRQTKLGDGVGYVVRGERRAAEQTPIVYMTPGVALRSLEGLDAYRTIVLDEFHERRLDVDLLLALLGDRANDLVVMSATLDGDGLARHLGGEHIHAPGRTYPVDVRYRADGVLLPTARDLDTRVASALSAVASLPGDILVFLPGKAEIAEVARGLRGSTELDVLPLHGALTLDAQTRVFRPSARRKVILATNVAETSLTVPGVGVVIDSGLVRRTRYHEGRGYLALTAIAKDSADQRSGRAGRMSAGVALRLWDKAAQLLARTPPEMHRESLTPLVLGAAFHGRRVERLRFWDPPKSHALDAARQDLAALGALDAEGGITDLGRELQRLPLDAPHARLIVEARARGTLADTVDMVAALSVGRPLFIGPPAGEEDLRDGGCDGVALVRAVRGATDAPGLNRAARREAQERAAQLRKLLSVDAETRLDRIDRRALAMTVLGADRRSAYVARRRKKRVAFSNGGTEVELGRASGVRSAEVEVVALLDIRGLDEGPKRRMVMSAAMPVKAAWLVELGFGQDRVGAALLERGEVVADVERVYARRVLATRRVHPEGALARAAGARLFVEGRLFGDALAESQRRLADAALLHQLSRSPVGARLGLPEVPPPPALEVFILKRLTDLGVESGEDLALLSPDDLLPEAIAPELRPKVESEFPRSVSLGDASYAAEYDLDKRQVILRLVRGSRRSPPPRGYLPKFAGLRVFLEAGGTFHRM